MYIPTYSFRVSWSSCRPPLYIRPAACVYTHVYAIYVYMLYESLCAHPVRSHFTPKLVLSWRYSRIYQRYEFVQLLSCDTLMIVPISVSPRQFQIVGSFVYFFLFSVFFFFFIDELASGGWRSSRWPVATSTSEKGLILPRWPSRRRDFQAGGGTLCKQVLRAFRSSRYDFIANHRSPRRFSREIEGGRKITNKCDYLRDNEQKERYLTDKRADWRRTRSPAAVFAISMDSTLDEVSRSVMKTDGNNSFLIFFFNLKSNQQQGH